MRDREEVNRDRIQSEQVRTLFVQTPAALVAHLFDGLVVATLLWTRESHNLLAGWLSVLVLASAARLVLSRKYVQRNPPADQWRSWAFVAVAVAGVFGTIWGAAVLLFLDMSDPVSVVVVVTVVVGLNAGAASTTASYPPMFYTFTAPSFMSMFWVFIASGTTTGFALAVLAAAALVTYPLICQGMNRVLERSLRLGFENEALRLEAERANAAKTRFLAAASHDLRQPIHALGLSFATLAEKLRNEETQPVIDQVEGSINAVDAMLSSLLDISKLDAGIVSPSPEPISVSKLFGHLSNEVSPLAAERGNRLRICRCDAWVQSDPSMLQRILCNLLGNALRYTSNGRVLLAARRRGKNLRFEVRDTGPGIPADRYDDVFVEFEQLGNPQRDRRQGLGLGLAIVKRLASLLGHSIGLRSTLGRGSCFWIDVPLAQENVLAEAPTGELLHQHHNPLLGSRVLVLDDESTILQSMRNLLAHWGCQVDSAANTDEAESALRSHVPDLLIADYRLGGESTGLDAVSQLGAIAREEIPVLIITGDTAPERLREARDSGYPLLHKPVPPARLRSAMQHLTTKSGPQRRSG